MTVQADNISASAWLDNKVVTVMFAGFSPLATSTFLRKQKNGTFPCPLAINSYNKFMGGVDRGDQLQGYYATKIRSRKYSNFLVGVSLINSFTKLVTPVRRLSSRSLRRFWQSRIIAANLGLDVLATKIAPLPLQHYPSKVASDRRKRGRCSLCQEKHKRRDTQWFCRECEVWLCHPGTTDDCFLLWHRRRLQ